VAVFIAPMMLGGDGAPTPIAGAGLGLGDALRLTDVTTRSLGGDWLIEANVSRR